MAIHIVEEANRCLGCKRAFCQIKGCPVQTPIPQVIDLFKQRRLEEAGELLFQNNPMSAVCSVVCNHSGQCEGACIQGRKGTPGCISRASRTISPRHIWIVRSGSPHRRAVNRLLWSVPVPLVLPWLSRWPSWAVPSRYLSSAPRSAVCWSTASPSSACPVRSYKSTVT